MIPPVGRSLCLVGRGTIPFPTEGREGMSCPICGKGTLIGPDGQRWCLTHGPL